MTLFLAILFLSILVISANLVAARQPPAMHRRWTVALAAMNLPLVVFGAIFILIPVEMLAPLLVEGAGDIRLVRADGVTMLVTASAGLLSVWGPVRRLVASVTQLRPDHPVHVTALMLAGYLLGSSVGSLLQGGLLNLTERAQPASIADIGLNYLLFLVLALTGTGLFVRRDLNTLGKRLGLTRPTLRQLGAGAAIIIPLIVLQAIIAAIWAYADPDQAALLENINTILYSDFDTVGEWLLLALATGMAEEILFRGALQPVFGLWGTALLFAVAHTQYALSPATLAVFLLALVLGIMRRRSNTTTVILIHAGYNFLLGLASLAASNLT